MDLMMIKAFDKPPKFTKAQREKYFHINEKLDALLKTLCGPLSINYAFH